MIPPWKEFKSKDISTLKKIYKSGSTDSQATSMPPISASTLLYLVTFEKSFSANSRKLAKESNFDRDKSLTMFLISVSCL